MRTGDFVWAGTLGFIVALLVMPSTHEVFIALTKSFPVWIGFVKFAVLATMGELLAGRIVSGKWSAPVGVVWRAVIWGFLGMVITVTFEIFATGVGSAIKKGLLPVGEGSVAWVVTAFWISTFMNLTFAPTFMAFHRITDTYLDLAGGDLGKISGVSVKQVVGHIDWYGFISFVILKTVPFFWIPAHTITFLLPPEYRVLVAAFLSIALGGILAFAKRPAKKA